MQSAIDKQFTLKEDGRIYFQVMASNPLPGEPVAKIGKGESVLRPRVEMLGDREGRDRIEKWLQDHIRSVLEPLVALENTEGLKGPARGIVFQLYEALGILPREILADLIAGLDQDDRRDLRSRKVRLGPILVFIPALNKPAAVRLRALLWALHQDKDLPVSVPADGIVSCEIDPATIDRHFYQAIGYPVFGKRAVRIDMLDRVISAVYDSAENGKFKARHEMAEWLGCPIEGLYDVLQAMGHRRIPDPVVAEPQEGPSKKGEPESLETASEDVAISSVETASVETLVVEGDGVETAPPAGGVKPELAMFFLKKGKAFEKPQFKKQGAPKDSQNKSEKRNGGGKRNKTTNRSPKIMQTGPERKLEDSPFAILEQLKVKQDGKN